MVVKEWLKMPEDREKIIQLNHVGVTYKTRKSFFESEKYQALKDICLDVYKGETLGIIGRNGAGKSTLLRLLAGIIKPDRGRIIHHTTSVSLMALAAGFDNNLSGRQNTIISGMLMGHSKKEIKATLEDIKAFSELAFFFEKPVKHYSSGMRARLAFSVAMYTSPDVLLIDEVLGVGDAGFKQKATQALEEKIASDITVVIVSHSEAQIIKLANRVVWVDGGKVRRQGTPYHIFPEYNMSPAFSALNLKIEFFDPRDPFFIQVEGLELQENTLKFNCVIIHKDGRNIDKVMARSGSRVQEFTGPTPTPLLGDRFPRSQNPGLARYHGGSILLGRPSVIDIISDGWEITALDILIERL